LSPPGQSNRTDKSRLLAVLGISEDEYVARYTSVIQTDWVMRCTARLAITGSGWDPELLRLELGELKLTSLRTVAPVAMRSISSPH
jgi:hypothetical protein